MTDDLLEFLRARLYADEQAATRCGHVRRTWDGPNAMDDECTAEAGHITKHGPWQMLSPAPPETNKQMSEAERRRVLREVEAKRRIMAEHCLGATALPHPGGPAFGCETCHNDREYGIGSFGYCDTLKLLALPYADRDGYREEWRP